MPIECKLVSKVSSKTGNPYEVLEIKLSPYYTKTVFIDNSEKGYIEILKAEYKKVNH